MSVSDDYRQHALECLRLAQAADDARSKALLLEMAQAWVNLADQAKARAEPTKVGR